MIFTQKKILLTGLLLSTALVAPQIANAAAGTIGTVTDDYVVTFASQTSTSAATNATVDVTAPETLADGLTINGDGTHTGDVTFDGDIDIGAGGIAFTADGDNNKHSFIFNGTSKVDGDIGTTTRRALEIEGGAATKTVTFNGDVFATTVTVSGTGTLDFNGDVTGTTLAYGTNAGTVTIADGKNLTAAVTATNTGTLTLEGKTTVSGAIATLGVLNAGADGKTATFSGDVASTTINVTGTGTLDFNGDVTATTLAFTGDGEVKIADDKDLTAAVTTTVAGTGNLTIEGTSTITGQIGTNAKYIGDVIAGVTGETVTFANKVYAQNFTTNAGTGTVTFNDLFDLVGNFTNTGTVTLAGATNVIGGDLTNTSGTLNLTADGSTTVVEGNIDHTAGTINLGNNTLSAVAYGVGDNAATIKTTISGRNTTTGDLTGGNIALTSAFTFDADKVLTITPTIDGVAVQTGDVLTFINSGGVLGTTYDADFVTVTPSGLITWAKDATVNGGKDFTLTATVAKASTIAGVSAGVSGAIDNATDDIGAAVQNLTTGAALNDAGQQLSPNSSGGNVAGAQGASSLVSNVVSGRVGGVASGDVLQGVGAWGEVFGVTADQDKRSSIDGYEAETYGLALGGDKELNEKLVVGLALSYADTSVDGKGAVKNNTTDIDSYGLTLYGTQKLNNNFYVDGSLGYTFHDFDSKRVVTVGAVNQTLKADFDGNEYIAKIGAGRNFATGCCSDLIITPFADLRYSHLDLDGYTENGGTAALKVDDESVDSLKSSLGVKFAAELKGFTPEFRAAWVHEFGDVEAESTSTYATGGAKFKTKGLEVDRDAALIGASVDFAEVKGWELSVNYDGEFKSDYDSHTGSVKAKYNF